MALCQTKSVPTRGAREIPSERGKIERKRGRIWDE
jgi:hypothetical protein